MTTHAEEISIIAAKPTQSIVLVSPETASRWLEHNKRNRPISMITVGRYKRDMEAGNWAYTADPIRFDVNGELLDGQHRLHALGLLHNVSIPMLVVRGLPTDSQLFMDQGRKRTTAQQLSLTGHGNAHVTAAAARLYIGWSEGLLFRDTAQMGTISAPDIQAWIADNEDLVAYVSGFLNSTKSNDAPPSVGLCAAYMFANVSKEDCLKFFTALHTGADLHSTSPVLALRNRLQRIRKLRTKTSHREFLAMFIQAWNAWRTGKSLKVIPAPKGGAWTETTFPEPK